MAKKSSLPAADGTGETLATRISEHINGTVCVVSRDSIGAGMNKQREQKKKEQVGFPIPSRLWLWTERFARPRGPVGPRVGVVFCILFLSSQGGWQAVGRCGLGGGRAAARMWRGDAQPLPKNVSL